MNETFANALQQSGFEAPNLDGLCIDPKELRQAAAVLQLLGTYAEFKAAAMEKRLAGDINAALRFESGCDSTYRRLPPWARW